jgi:hypothetical protein
MVEPLEDLDPRVRREGLEGFLVKGNLALIHVMT